MLAAAVFGFCAPSAIASTTTINFESPVISGGPAGEALGEQYETEGVVFSPAGAAAERISHHLGSTCGGAELYRTEDAHSGKQVAYSYCETDEGLEFHDSIVGAFSTGAPRPSEHVSVWVGEPGGTGHHFAPGGFKVTLTGYNLSGQEIAGASQSATIRAGEEEVATPLSISASSATIAYFSVSAAEPEGPPIEIDDLEFGVPAGLPPAQIALEPIPALPYEETPGRPGETVHVPVVVKRYFGATEKITLAVTGLPAGVKVTGGTEIAPSASQTTLTFAVAANATPTVSEYTVTATSPDLGEPASVEGAFAVFAALELNPKQGAISMTACPTSREVSFGLEGIPGSAALELNGQGDTSGLEAKLSATSLAPGSRVTLKIASATGAGGPGTATYTITARNGSYSAASKVTVTRTAGAITAIYGNPAETPQMSRSGSIVEVAGTGLCAGSTIEFGNSDAVVSPSAVGPEGGSLTATVPFYATSGPVTVHSPAGAIVSTKPLQVDNFRDTWGWPWENRGTPKYLSYGLIESIFGNSESTWDETDWPSIDARIFKGYASELIEEGSCLGMVGFVQYLSEDSENLYALNQVEAPMARTGDYPFDFASSAAAPAALEEAISIFHFDQFSAQYIEFEFEEHEASHRPLQAIEQIKQSFAQSTLGPSFLGASFDFITLENQGAEGGGHAVMPYAVAGDGSGGYYIYVYNPNRPYVGEESSNAAYHKQHVDESRIHVNSNGEWSFQDGFPTLWHGDSQHLTVVPWGKLPVPYAFGYPEDRQATPRPEIPGIGTGLNLFSDWIGASSSGGSASMSQVTDSRGHTLITPQGTENVDPATRIAHSQLHYPATVGTKSGSPTAWLPDGGSYQIKETGKSKGQYSETLLSSGMDAIVQAGAQPGVSDAIGVVPGTHTVSFSGGSTKALSLNLISSAGHDVTHSAELTTTSHSGFAQSLSFTGSNLVYHHTGPGTTIELQLSTAARESAPVAISTGPIEVGTGQSAVLSPTSWGSLSALRVTVSGHGAPRTLLIHGSKLSPVKGLSVKVSKRAGRKVTLTIAGRIGSLPSGAQLKYIWAVTDGSRVLAHHVLQLTGSRLRPGVRSESITFTAPAAGHYRFRGEAALLVAQGVIEQGSNVSKSVDVAIK